jgi:hypothetical protein
MNSRGSASRRRGDGALTERAEGSFRHHRTQKIGDDGERE